MLKGLEKEKLILKNFKLTEAEYQKIKKLSNELAKGNFSAYVRHACLNYKPKKSELTKEPK